MADVLGDIACGPCGRRLAVCARQPVRCCEGCTHTLSDALAFLRAAAPPAPKGDGLVLPDAVREATLVERASAYVAYVESLPPTPEHADQRLLAADIKSLLALAAAATRDDEPAFAEAHVRSGERTGGNWRERLAAVADACSGGHVASAGGVLLRVYDDPHNSIAGVFATDLRAALAASASPGGGGLDEDLDLLADVTAARLDNVDPAEREWVIGVVRGLRIAANVARGIPDRVFADNGAPTTSAAPAGPGGGLDREAAVRVRNVVQASAGAHTLIARERRCACGFPVRKFGEWHDHADEQLAAALAPLLTGGGE